MKKIISFLSILLIQTAAQAKTITPQLWCIQSISSGTDSLGKSYTDIVLNNHDTIPYSYYQNFIRIAGLVSGKDTLIDEANFKYVIFKKDTTLTLRIDTAWKSRKISSVFIEWGEMSCGIYWHPKELLSYFCQAGSQTTEIIEAVSEPEIKLYPNPAKGMLFVSSKVLENMQVRIINMEGKTMYMETIQNNSWIDISLLSKGMYFLKMNKEIHKFMVE